MYTEPIDERLTGKLIFYFVMTLPLQPTAFLNDKIRKKKSFCIKKLEIGAMAHVKCFRVSKKKKRARKLYYY